MALEDCPDASDALVQVYERVSMLFDADPIKKQIHQNLAQTLTRFVDFGMLGEPETNLGHVVEGVLPQIYGLIR